MARIPDMVFDVTHEPGLMKVKLRKGASAMRNPYWVVAVKEPTKNEREDGGESEIVALKENRLTVVMADSKEEACLRAADGQKIEKGVKLRAGPFPS